MSFTPLGRLKTIDAFRDYLVACGGEAFCDLELEAGDGPLARSLTLELPGGGTRTIGNRFKIGLSHGPCQRLNLLLIPDNQLACSDISSQHKWHSDDHFTSVAKLITHPLGHPLTCGLHLNPSS